MFRSIITRYALASIFLLSLTTVRAIAQEGEQTDSTNPIENTTPPNSTNPSLKPQSILSLEGGKKLVAEANQAIDAQQYDVAANKLQTARQIFNQLSNFYLQLFNSFSGLDNRIAESQRQKALETGQLRDEATYQLALVHRSQDKSELSVPLLVQIIDSQSPSSGLGKKAYEQLVEIGFVDVPLSEPESPSGNTTPENLQPQQ
jgi:hypothetical protein